MSSLREALAEIAGIASQRGSDKNVFSIADYSRLGDIERRARQALDAQRPQEGHSDMPSSGPSRSDSAHSDGGTEGTSLDHGPV